MAARHTIRVAKAVSAELTLRKDIVAQGAKLAASGLSQGTSGNLSARCGAGFLITPSGTPYEGLAADDVVLVDMAGHYAHPLRPSSEWRFHRDIYAARPDVHAVVHVHPPYSTALAMCRLAIPAAHYMIAVGGGDSIRCADYHTYGTQALSDAVLQALEGRLACLMANHGMLATGTTLAQAMWRAIEVENLARQYALARQVGKPVLLTDGEITEVLEKFAHYGLMSVKP
ncbi:class II aldolase/adducin family protein [Dyella sp. RRB7]|uniref:class II aldolase/adducin family protein n=1 Tax=Dyella sp. RRB7 TaxID=2919502 RepID=UPI001FAAB31E|nr:class II aldolase/adducin family protein [Dyella sp. RRB7]